MTQLNLWLPIFSFSGENVIADDVSSSFNVNSSLKYVQILPDSNNSFGIAGNVKYGQTVVNSEIEKRASAAVSFALQHQAPNSVICLGAGLGANYIQNQDGAKINPYVEGSAGVDFKNGNSVFGNVQTSFGDTPNVKALIGAKIKL